MKLIRKILAIQCVDIFTKNLELTMLTSIYDIYLLILKVNCINNKLLLSKDKSKKR